MEKIINSHEIVNKNNKNNDRNWPFRMLIIGPSGSSKTNALLHLIQNLNDTNPIDKIYLYAKDLGEPKYKFLIDNREKAGIKHFSDSTAFIEYSNTMDDVFKNIDDYNTRRKRRVLIVFDDMIADTMTNKKFQSIIKELFIKCRKLNISIVFSMQSYFKTPKDARLNSTHYLLMKIQSKKELQNIAWDNSGDIDFKDFLKIYRDCTSEPFSFMTIDTTLSSSDPMRFRKNFRNVLIKMTKIDQLKILDNKIRAFKAQHDLDREAAKISALSSGELEKYEHLSGEDLGYKPDVVQKAKFEYSPLGKVFNKGLDEDDKKEGLLIKD